jgi:NMD protein affecting ribosome stability and mRNA decay
MTATCAECGQPAEHVYWGGICSACYAVWATEEPHAPSQ